jgi:hypothetical protein
MEFVISGSSMSIVLACDEKYKCMLNEVLPCFLEKPSMNNSNHEC